MNWNLWAKKFAYNILLAVIPVVIAAIEQAQNQSPKWAALTAILLIALRQVQNWAMHKNG